jgi:hypothetical protein
VRRAPEPCGDAEHAEALRLLLRQAAGDTTWRPECYDPLASIMAEGVRTAAEPLPPLDPELGWLDE